MFRNLKVVFLVLSGATLLFANVTAAQASGAAIYGAGSTWSQIAVDQWRADVKSKLGLNVDYTGNASSAGRAMYIQGKVDFAVSEIPFSKEGEPGVVDGQAEVTALNAEQKPYQYFPIVAGGTSLMYNLVDASGHRITNLQLSPDTIAEIYTGKIKNWNDPAITTDNGGHALPSKTIVPVYGVPVASKYLRGEDSLYSIVQMPKGIPVATFAIGEAGAANAALHVIAGLALHDADLAKRLEDFRLKQSKTARSINLPGY